MAYSLRALSVGRKEGEIESVRESDRLALPEKNSPPFYNPTRMTTSIRAKLGNGKTKEHCTCRVRIIRT